MKKKRREAPAGFTSMPRMNGYAVIESVPKSSYRDTSMVILIPSRDEWLHRRFIEHLNAIQWPMTGKRALFHIQGAEVGKAYSDQIMSRIPQEMIDAATKARELSEKPN